MTGLLQHVRDGARQLRKSPGFTATALITLALGIGASVAVFSIFDAVLLRPLPYQDPSRLVAVWNSEIRQPGSKIFAPYRDFEEFKAHSRSFEKLAALTWARPGETLSWHGSAHEVLAIPATDEFFSLMGIPAEFGRTFGSQDLLHGCTVVLSHSFWQTELGSPRDVVGSTLALNGQSCAVVGVMPRGFEFYPRQTSLWTLITPDSTYVKEPFDSVVGIFGRLRPGVAIASAEQELVAVHQRVIQSAPSGSWVAQTTPIIHGLREEFTWLAGRNLKISVFTLCGAIALLLLIACLNVANLLQVRCDHRQRELALRSALGASKLTLVRYLLTQSLLISTAGTVLGVLIAALALGYFNSANPVELPPGAHASLNFDVIAFCAIVAAATGLLCGCVPAFRVLRLDPNEILKRSGGRVPAAQRTTHAFVACQAALSMVVLAVAGLMIESIAKLTSVPLGLEARQVLTAQLSLPAGSYRQPPEPAAFYTKLLARVAALPGINGAAVSSSLGPYDGGLSGELAIKGQPPIENLEAINRVDVSSDYFRVLSMPLLRGRNFDTQDRSASEPAAIVNEEFIRAYITKGNPLGQQIKLGKASDKGPWLTIVGVVGSEKRASVYHEMDYVEPALVYLPVDQTSDRSMGLLVKVDGNPLTFGPLLHREISALDENVAIYDVKTMHERYSEFLAYPRFRAELMGLTAGLTLMLSAIGFYSLLSHVIAQRTQEIGVRMALGAPKATVMTMVVARGAQLATIGICSGTVIALMVSRTMKSLLYGVSATSPSLFADAAGLLLVISLIASYIPAHRAAKVDPMVALRYE